MQTDERMIDTYDDLSLSPKKVEIGPDLPYETECVNLTVRQVGHFAVLLRDGRTAYAALQSAA